ncbi:hypothetical protein OB2597_13163 [Pseudooceanicola batsensis HTCC2597]|uniref:DUF2793 domain-containing protein n=1 Tax=Pseudooceanicola batsensis (strain ATCC BAA-863 / DSM 15984 / KCTC 12145 / HTCC2597) TaxID=252305 RepID=A3TY61_PSEBH|nr:DUF2793 domain-containing protein [Pseudooceanicola batsensis]EAQ03095.1 hypothetical protein OB2597_13163 [Pseudooceanicola batsensis HTCC2597]
MSDRSANLMLPYIQPSQAQKHVTHNEALLALDALVQLGVLSADTAAEPADPAEGDRYILPAGATGAWSGRDGDLAMRAGEGWVFLAPRAGWSAWVADTGQTLRHDGTGWSPEISDHQNLAMVGVNAAADAGNRLTVASGASLLTHEGAGHQVKINKAAASDTASLVFQTGWSGRAELGTVGSDAFDFKVSDDGATFHTALRADPATGVVDFPNGATGLTDPALGAGTADLVPQDYVVARGTDLFANGSGLLGTGYNFPAQFTRDPAVSPGLPAAFRHAGHAPGPCISTETIPVDPRLCYRVGCALRQEGLAGDWSAHAQQERHRQSFGIVCLDADGLVIEPLHHGRFRSGGTDSLTFLAAPLSPGDTQIQLTDAAGWNDSDPDADTCGVVIFGYRSAGGQAHDLYSRIAATDLFVPAGVNKTTHVVTLAAPLPAALGNPGDGGGTWPAGTPLANSAAAGGHKRAVLDGYHLPATDSWVRVNRHIGGIDGSGGDVAGNFAPGTAAIRLVWWPNETNQPGGVAGYPDTGAAHRVWFAAASVLPDPLAVTEIVTTGPLPGSKTVHAPVANIAGGRIDLAAATLVVEPL